jgi:hypothetical protein
MPFTLKGVDTHDKYQSFNEIINIELVSCKSITIYKEKQVAIIPYKKEKRNKNIILYDMSGRNNLLLREYYSTSVLSNQVTTNQMNKLEKLFLLIHKLKLDHIQFKFNKIIDEITNILIELINSRPLQLGLCKTSFTINKFDKLGPIIVRPKLFHYFSKEGKLVKEFICRILNNFTLEDVLLYSLSLPIDNKDLKISESPDKISISVNLFRLLTFPVTTLKKEKENEINNSMIDNSRPKTIISFNDMTTSDRQMLRLSITLYLDKRFTSSSSLEIKKGLKTYKIETKLNIKSHKVDSLKYINILTHTKGGELYDTNIIQQKKKNKKNRQFILIDILRLWKKEITKYKKQKIYINKSRLPLFEATSTINNFLLLTRSFAIMDRKEKRDKSLITNSFSLEEIRNYIMKFILNYKEKDKKYNSDTILLQSNKKKWIDKKSLVQEKLLQEPTIHSGQILPLSLSRKFSTLKRRHCHTTSNKSNNNCESMSSVALGGNIPLNKEKENTFNLDLEMSVPEKLVNIVLTINLNNKSVGVWSSNFINIYSQNLTGNPISFFINPNKIIRITSDFEYFEFKTISSLEGERKKDYDISNFSYYSIYNNKVFAIFGGKEVFIFSNDSNYLKDSSLLNKNKIIPYVKKFIVLFIDPNCILFRPILKVVDELIVPLK